MMDGRHFRSGGPRSRGCSVLDSSLQPLHRARESETRWRNMRVPVWSEHAIADGEGIVLFDAGGVAATGRGDAIGQMPWPELIGAAGVRGEPKLELALELAGYVKDHDPVCGTEFQRHRS